MKKMPQIGVSRCLLGEPVRFDGGHKRSARLTEIFAQHMQFTPICPELGVGLGTPRPAIRLQLINGQSRLVVSQDNEADLTDAMQAYANEQLPRLAHLDGFVFKKGSPSCGVWRVPVVVHEEGHKRHDGTGVFARIFMQHYPWIPVEEEGRLNDEALRVNFLERVYALHRWHQIEHVNENLQAVIEFHSRHKFMLMARSPEDYRSLGRFIAETNYKNLATRHMQYLQLFMQAMQKPISRGRHVNVLMHIMGYIKQHLSHEDKQEILLHMESYRNQHLPLASLIVLLRHYLRSHPDGFVEHQYYLEPYPRQIVLHAAH